MPRKGFLILALICGLIAASSAYFYLQKVKHTTVMEMKPLVVAKTNISARSIIQASQLTIRDVPSQGYPQGGISNLAAVTGTVALINLNQGDLVLSSVLDRALVTANTPGGVNLSGRSSLAVPPGKRAVAVPISLVSGVGYQVKAGDYVDVLVTMDKKSQTGETQAYTSLAAQDVLVLGTGESITGDKSKVDAKAYILALSVPQSMTITLGSEKGTIRLLLRNPSDNQTSQAVPVNGSTFSDSDYFTRFK